MIPEPPPIRFSGWFAWDCRPELKRQLKKTGWERRTLGVYMWAHFHEAPRPETRPRPEALPREVIYVGETKDLFTRPLSGNDHQRLDHYRDTFPADGTEREHLYLSVYPVAEHCEGSADSRALHAYTQYVEAWLYWQYVQQYQTRAALHYKKKGKEHGAQPACCASIRRSGRR